MEPPNTHKPIMEKLKEFDDVLRKLRIDPKQLVMIAGGFAQHGGDLDDKVLVQNAPPSRAQLGDLRPLTFKGLTYNQKHPGRVIYLVIRSVSLHRGMNMEVEDSCGVKGPLWSLIEYPCPGGKAAMVEGTIIAVKEPFYGQHLYGDPLLAAGQPTDIVRISPYDDIVQSFFPQHSGRQHDDFSKAGDTAFATGKTMDAIDIYAEGIGKAREIHSDDQPSSPLHGLLLKRAFAYTRLDLHVKALLDLTDILVSEPTNKKALKLTCISCLNLDKVFPAVCCCLFLISLEPKNADYRALSQRVGVRMKQALGVVDTKFIVSSVKRGDLQPEISTFVASIEVRQSTLHGRGVFAKRNFEPGDLLICEKPLIVSFDTTQSSFGNGEQPDENGFMRRWMSVFQQLATTAITDPFKARKLFCLSAGKMFDPPSNTSWKVSDGYDTSRASQIIRHNHHLINRGSNSNYQSYYGRIGTDTLSLPDSPKAPGLWYRTSMFNHYCVPNATYTWIGDVMLVTAIRHISEDQEITVAYCDSPLSYQQRKERLEGFGFECSCPLCTVEAKLLIKPERKEIMDELNRAQSSGDLENLLTCMAISYSVADYGELPWLELNQALLVAAHKYLGSLSEWPESVAIWGTEASDAFLSMLQIGSGIILAKDPKSGYCELLSTKFSHPNPLCVAALFGLAEIEYLKSERPDLIRVAAVLRCAQDLYNVLYGEIETFADHYEQYRCNTAIKYIGQIPQPVDWDQTREAIYDAGVPLPPILRKTLPDKKQAAQRHSKDI